MITLHHCHQSRSMRVLWLLHELQADIHVIVHPFNKALRDPNFLKVSPAGRVPAMEMDGKTYFESTAMAQILCRRFPDQNLGRAPEDDDWEDWLTWLNFAETFAQSLAALTMQHVTLRDPSMQSPTVMKLEARRLGKCFDAVELQLSNEDAQPYLLSSGFTAADVAVGHAVWLSTRFFPLDGHPKTEAWLQRLMARPAFQKSLPPAGAELIYTQDFYEVPDA